MSDEGRARVLGAADRRGIAEDAFNGWIALAFGDSVTLATLTIPQIEKASEEFAFEGEKPKAPADLLIAMMPDPPGAAPPADQLEPGEPVF